MTVESTSSVATFLYTGPGIYSYSFKAYLNSDITVSHLDTSGNVTLLTEGTHYTLVRDSDNVGGSVTSVYSATTGTLEISRVLPLTQSVALENQGPLDMETMEIAFDRNVMMMQQVQDRVEGNSIISNWRGDWATGVDYYLKDFVEYDTNWYACLEGHTSGTFATDLSSGNWKLVLDVVTIYDEARDLMESIADDMTAIGDRSDAIKTDHYTATAAQTAFTITQPTKQENILAFLNTRKLRLTEDYTLNSTTAASVLTLNSGAAAGDELDIISFNTFDLTGLAGDLTDAVAAAQAAQLAAETAKTHAETAKTNAETAETNAETAETNARAAQLAAEAAKLAAETAEAHAETAETNAETAETNAEAAQLAAEAAQLAAETAETNAETAETNTQALLAASLATNEWFRCELIRALIPLQTDTLLSSANIVDVFIYDTSLDSDGGAWRLNCQDLSWYNEVLNTTTRGASREFPAIALIVAETTKITILDASVSGCPMWRVFNQNSAIGTSGEEFWRQTKSATSVHALNGKMVFGLGVARDGACGVAFVDFLNDRVGRYSAVSVAYGGVGSPIKDHRELILDNSLPLLNDTKVNDVFMSILSSAPVDSGTGLSVPTIDVATDAGISVIDGLAGVGTVVDLLDVAGDDTNNISRDAGSNLWYTNETQGNLDMFLAADITADDASPNQVYDVTSIPALLANPTTTKLGIKSYNARVAVGHSTGLTLLNSDVTTQTSGMVAYITKDYNTGWMKGDIRRAVICDADKVGEILFAGTTIADYSIKASSFTIAGTLTRYMVASDGVTESAIQEIQGILDYSSSNYIVQSYSADLDFGTGSFNICLWFKQAASSVVETLISRMYYTGGAVSGPAFVLYIDSDSTIKFKIANDWASTTDQIVSSAAFDNSKWNFLSVQKSGLTLKMSVNGVSAATNVTVSSATGTLNNSNASLMIGNSQLPTLGAAVNCAISLVRIGAVALTDADILTMYNEELPLFQLGAGCTLQGTSNVVQSIDYDDRYNALGVGTADGVTVFHNLMATTDYFERAGSIKALSLNAGAAIAANATDAYYAKSR